jgi:hypothetical protein
MGSLRVVTSRWVTNGRGRARLRISRSNALGSSKAAVAVSMRAIRCTRPVGTGIASQSEAWNESTVALSEFTR